MIDKLYCVGPACLDRWCIVIMLKRYTSVLMSRLRRCSPHVLDCWVCCLVCVGCQLVLMLCVVMMVRTLCRTRYVGNCSSVGHDVRFERVVMVRGVYFDYIDVGRQDFS